MQNQLRCPSCGQVFQVDESGYAAIVQQIRDQEFQIEVNRRAAVFEEEKKAAVAMAVSGEQQKFMQQQQMMSAKVAQLETQLQSVKTEAELSAEKAVSEVSRQADRQMMEYKSQMETQMRQANDEWQRLYNEKVREVEYYKDFKTRLSTKMVGESLEQFCENEFNKIRATAFPYAYFEKDNEVKAGSKGDYIFRETDSTGTEIVSIMFEMKNEMDQTATKHKNEDFLKELDKDRTAKGCEYAVLVSLLESESELYNTGIVDVSHKYPKMYIIRPQFFIPMIGLLRNAGMNALTARQQLVQYQQQNLDVVKFEAEVREFKEKFGRNYRLASDRFQDAVAEIDKSISHLQKIKDALLQSENHLRLANNKAEELSIKKLTKNNPVVAAQFAAQGLLQ